MLAMSALSTVTVVIRSAGERTENSCRSLILEQGLSPGSLFIVRERPFSKTLRSGYEIGIHAGKPWTLFVDADLLLRAKSIEKLVGEAQTQRANICEFQGYCLDKFYGGIRVGGVHLYRTALLEEVLRSIPEEDSAIRPESSALEKMASKGFPRKVLPELVGLHDFDQDYKDIFRKCFVHARKHAVHIPLFVPFWRERAQNDNDYKVALAGLAAGVQYFGPIEIDSDALYFAKAFEEVALNPKVSLEAGEWNLEHVESTITSWQEPELYRDFKPFGMVQSDAGPLLLWLSLYKRQSAGRSLLRGFLVTVLVLLRRLIMVHLAETERSGANRQHGKAN